MTIFTIFSCWLSECPLDLIGKILVDVDLAEELEV
jgi:hypothetical protein